MLLIALPSIASAQSTENRVVVPATSLQGAPVATNPPGVPPEYVITPAGYFHPTCVKQLAQGETLEGEGRTIRHVDGTAEEIQGCTYPRYNSRGEAVDTSIKSGPPSISHSWIEDVSVTSTTSFGQLNAVWLVPPSPVTSDGQTIYFFPGLEDANNVVSILQPVLGWSNGQWSIASWNCCVNGTIVESTPVNVNPGDTIVGSIKDTCAAGTLSCPTWNITTTDSSSGNSTSLINSGSDGQTFNWAFAGALEVYNVSVCSDYPPNAGLTFSSVSLYDDAFHAIASPGWSLAPASILLSPQCNYGGSVAPTQTSLDYGALGVSLRANAVSGPAPLTTSLIASTGGTTSGNTNYFFWWNCSSLDTSVTNVEAQCGTLSSSCTSSAAGLECNGQATTSYAVSHTYSTAGTYIAKVIVERGSAPPAQAQLIVSVGAAQKSPTVTTVAASNVTAGSATLAGTVNPNGLTTSEWFQWGTNSTSLLNSTGTASATGTTAGSFSMGLSGLTPRTTYYYRTAAQNGAGASYGAILSFTTQASGPPAVTTLAASNVTSTTATLNGTVNPDGLSTTLYFQWGTTTALGSSSGTSTTTGTTAGGWTLGLTGLTPNTTYYFRIVAQNSAGTSDGAILSFTTSFGAPTVTTLAATNVTVNSATLNGTVNPNGLSTTLWFQWGTTTALGSSSGTATTTGTTAGAWTLGLTGLAPNTTYYYRLVAQNSGGTINGAILSFKTLGAPIATTLAATSVTASTATLNGTVNPNGLSTTLWFQWGTTTALGSSSGTATTTGTTAGGWTLGLTGLSPGVTYYFRIVAQNSSGTSDGAVLSFTTP